MKPIERLGSVAVVVLLVAVVVLSWMLWRDREARHALAEAQAADIATLRGEVKAARAAQAEADAELEAASAVRAHAEERLAEVERLARDRIRVVRVREREIVAQPPSQAGAAESMARAADFRRRLDALTQEGTP